MPRESFPEIKETKIYISTVYPGNTAEDIESLITKPLEDEFNNLSNITRMTSTSQEGYSIIIIEFDEKISVFEAKLKVKDRVDKKTADEDWPIFNRAKVEPDVFEINITEEMPILNINMRGDIPVVKLKDYAEEIKHMIESYPEIKQVDIRGVQDREVEVAVDIYKMSASRVSFDNIINAIKGGNVNISGGHMVISDERKTIRLIGEIDTPKDLESFVVKSEGNPIYLRDVANVYFKEKDKTTYARSFGENVVMLDVKKLSGRNQIRASEKIKGLLKNIRETILPKNVKIFITSDQSEQIENMVNDLVNNIIFGVILVVFVLMFFLNFRNALFVGIAIPMSMLLSYVIIHALGYTLNTMVLFALVMGLGMLVDNGIVVVENVYRLVSEEGMSSKEATKKGIGEISFPIIVSTATTVAAFVPLGFWPGVMGQFMIYFPIALSIVLGASLFVALFINPVLVSKYMKIEEVALSQNKLNRFSLIFTTIGFLMLLSSSTRGIGTLFIFIVLSVWAYRLFIQKAITYFQQHILNKIEEIYKRLIAFSLMGKSPKRFLFGTIGLLIFSFLLLVIKSPKISFFPDNKPNQILVYLEYPQGTDIEKTNAITKEVEQEVYKIINDDRYIDSGENFMIESAIAQVGKGAGNFQDAFGHVEMPHKGKITVLLKEFKYRRGEDSEHLRASIYEALSGKYPGIKLSVEKNQVGPPVGYPINIEISGDDYSLLVDSAKKISGYVNSLNIAGMEEMKVDVSKQMPILEVRVDREKAGALGVSAAQVGTQIRRALFGEKAGIYKYKDDDYDINVRFDNSERFNMNALMNQKIVFRDPASGKIKEVPVASIVETNTNSSFDAIKRINRTRVVKLYSGVLPGYNANEIARNIKGHLKSFSLNKGVSYKFTGEIEAQGKQMAFLSKALLGGVALIILLLVLQFNSFSKPMIIFLAIILSFIGVLLGLVIFNMNFVIMMTMLGIISLAGIVVNNAVVLLDYIQILINRKREELKMRDSESLDDETIKDIIAKGGKTRLRPVLITAITTVFGLIPLAIGLNIDFFSLFSDWDPKVYLGGDNVIFWSPLAWTVIFGLTFATFLTLIIVPVTLYISLRIKRRFNMVV
ncbi:multidrug resistance protein [Elysia marginata]|uniref:Multidrug resistance protein n=1 Tax=Elysia marginata TaxID=1093978 RepID=A0AAV4F069_9GAST|nr:multidrug resistance protein [Elysia marginata]